MSPKETDRPFVKTRHLRQRQTDHLTKYDIVKNRQKMGISQKGCKILKSTFNHHLKMWILISQLQWKNFLCLNKNAKKLACFQYLSIVGFDVGGRPFSEIRRSFYRPISIMRFLRFRLTDHKKINILYDIVYGWSLISYTFAIFIV